MRGHPDCRGLVPLLFCSVQLGQPGNFSSKVFAELDRCFHSLLGWNSEEIGGQCDDVPGSVAPEAVADIPRRGHREDGAGLAAGLMDRAWAA